MKTLALVLVVVVSGCASAAPPQLAPHDAAVVTEQDVSVWRKIGCVAPAHESLWCKTIGVANDTWLLVQPAIDAMGKLK